MLGSMAFPLYQQVEDWRSYQETREEKKFINLFKLKTIHDPFLVELAMTGAVKYV